MVLSRGHLSELRDMADRAKPNYGGGWLQEQPRVVITAETLIELVDFYADREGKDEPDVPLTCPRHNPVQHRDNKPPWCNACGMSADGHTALGDPRKLGQFVHHDVLKDLYAAVDERNALRDTLQRVADVQPVEHTHWDGSGAWLVYDAEEIKQALKGES